MKRACCLYIVPVKRYFNEIEREILRQKGSCYSFAARQGWSITKEIRGIDKIGGYTLNDVYKTVMDAAQNNEFDILLVSSCSLIEDCDTASKFIELFKTQAIEIWSVAEGQDCFENHSETIINLINSSVVCDMYGTVREEVVNERNTVVGKK